MVRQSLAHWRLPRAQDGVLLYEDRAQRDRFRSQERHSHAELELHFIERGQVRLLLQDHRLRASAGSLLWVPPGCDHLLLETSPDLRRWLLLVRVRAARKVLPAAGAAGLLTGARSARHGVLPLRAALGLRRTFAEVRSQARSPLPLVNAGLRYALARAFALFESATPSAEPERFHPAVLSALALLREQVPPPDLHELARRTRASPAHLSKLFSAQVGMSVTEFRNRVRLERFLSLHGEDSPHTLLATALDAGFGSYAQFHRVFRQLMGYSPHEHRG